MTSFLNHNCAIITEIGEIPNNIFSSIYETVTKVDWDLVQDNDRKILKKFSKTTSLFLRDVLKNETKKRSLRTWLNITECIDASSYQNFPEIKKIEKWIIELLNVTEVGKIFITKLNFNSEIPLHTDPLYYFDRYKRLHIPIITNPNVIFDSGPGTKSYFLKPGNIYYLNSRVPHRIVNNGLLDRVHLILDVATNDIL